MTKSLERRDRLAAALRANLKRRKAQERAKAAAQVRNVSAGKGSSVSSAAEAASLPHPRQNPAQKGE